MNLRNLFRVVAVIGILSGLGYLFAPQAASVMDLDPYGLYFLQQIGASNIAIALLLFLVSGMALCYVSRIEKPDMKRNHDESKTVY